jgi:hypothetical protein
VLRLKAGKSTDISQSLAPEKMWRAIRRHMRVRRAACKYKLRAHPLLRGAVRVQKCRARSYRFGLDDFALFASRTPAPPPFSGMNS